MGELIGLDHVAISEEGATLSMGIGEGQWIGVYGPAGAGKSVLLSVLAGLERPVRGSVSVHSPPLVVEPIPNLRKSKPQQLARKGRGPHFASIATEALMASRLWDQRNIPVAHLSASQKVAAELLPALTSNAPVIICDEQLDHLDPWAFNGVRKHLKKMKEQGTSLIAATNRVDWAEDFDVLLVLAAREVKYAGTPADLARKTRPQEVYIESDDQPGVRALVKPFGISVQTTQSGLRLEADEGQELAVDLLLKGYGNVRAVFHRAPNIEEALLGLVRSVY